jgi:predicted nucleic acid-binding Zn ribbon protein
LGTVDESRTSGATQTSQGYGSLEARHPRADRTGNYRRHRKPSPSVRESAVLPIDILATCLEIVKELLDSEDRTDRALRLVWPLLLTLLTVVAIIALVVIAVVDATGLGPWWRWVLASVSVLCAVSVGIKVLRGRRRRRKREAIADCVVVASESGDETVQVGGDPQR